MTSDLPGQIFSFDLPDNSFMGLLQKINSFTDVGQGGSLGIIFILITAGSLFLMMKAYGNDKAFAPAAVIAAILGMFLRLMSLVNDYTLYFCIVLLIVGLFLLIKDAAQYEQ